VGMGERLKPSCAFCGAVYLPTIHTGVDLPPFGRTLAYAATDRQGAGLWVVCHKCEQWNMVPLERADRLAAIDRLEQQFLSTPSRVIDANIGVADLEGFARGWRSGWQWLRGRGRQLIRVGDGGWWTFAAWRRGRLLWRRRIGWFAFIALNALQAQFWSDLAVAIGLVAMVPLLFAIVWYHKVCPIHVGDGRVGWVTPRLEGKAQLRLENGEPGLLVHHTLGASELWGDRALRALAVLLARRNEKGGSREEIAAAMRLIDSVGGSRDAFRRLEPDLLKARAWGVSLRSLSDPLALALEMAVHEEVERRHAIGELAVLRVGRDDAVRLSQTIERELS
jgi:hypothetical protein